MHIGFVSFDYPSQFGGGGVGNQVRTLGRALVQAGHRVTVIALADKRIPNFTEDHGIKVYRVHSGSLHWYISKFRPFGSLFSLAVRELEYSAAAYRQIKILHKQQPFDLIEGTESGALGVALWAKVPLVIRLHGERYTFYKYTPDLPLTYGIYLSRTLQRVAIRRARVLISPSVFHAKEISRELSKNLPPIVAIPNYIDLRWETARQDLSPHKVIVLFAGRLERCKGIPVLLEAASHVVRGYPEVTFILAGAPHPTLTRSEIDALIQRYNLVGHVQLLGHVPWEQLTSWYRRATLCVLPSYYETFGIAALEPMAFGVPVVATAVGGLPEVVEDGMTGILVPPGNAQALADAIMRLLSDPHLRCCLGKAGQERAETEFEVSRNLGITLECYKWAISKGLDHTDSSEVSNSAEHIFFSPHYDDVVFSCGGLIGSLLNQGKKVRVVNVFTGEADTSTYSAFARHLHGKWGMGTREIEQRSQEDAKALGILGVQDIERWDFLEAPYRLHASSRPLYASYDEIKGGLAAQDQQLAETLFSTVQQYLDKCASSAVLYFPLSLGHHVDHQLLFQVGIRLQAMRHTVRFYEDWPYVESYAPAPYQSGWLSHAMDISIVTKLSAAEEYRSQIKSLGGSVQSLSERLERFARQVGGSRPQERYWEVLQSTAIRTSAGEGNLQLPLARYANRPSLSDFANFLTSLRWHELDELLPIGEGNCLDIGCGTGRNRSIIEKKGYQWIGVEKAPSGLTRPILSADAQRLPFRTGKATAVITWQVMEYVEQPERVIAEAARVLEPGGIFCGSVSFLEPVHGSTFYGISPLLLDHLLRKYGFADVEIQPGLCCFALILWTWLRRWGGVSWGRLALPLTAIWLIPIAAARFLTSWLWWRLGRGTGYGMRWIVQTAPLEFAGQVVFVARKPAGSGNCASVS